ncbi:hypothetical protein LDENG_00007680, partial [Lucifuga dentata]
HLQKFADDSAIVGCVRRGQEEEYRRRISDFAVWCNQNHMQLNVTKTEEMVVDFRRTKTPITTVSIGGEKVELVQSYKYLGVYLDSKLDWSVNTEAIYRKSQSRLYFLRRLRSFGQSVVGSALFFAVICWGSSIKATDASRIDKLLTKAGERLLLPRCTTERHRRSFLPTTIRLYNPSLD